MSPSFPAPAMHHALIDLKPVQAGRRITRTSKPVFQKSSVR
ncbi:hypothetical protein PAMC26577_14825 [Caballeronia sordidicola]|uniref:Uncharacterized protein n=1 Tax=Caballeronia sordidicola TaxID=196367 RepID=A0A242MTH6_CABSO|nr:hypothetical protein PAMC26577_14825 [Caballeronia sordidicola]